MQGPTRICPFLKKEVRADRSAYRSAILLETFDFDFGFNFSLASRTRPPERPNPEPKSASLVSCAVESKVVVVAEHKKNLKKPI
jgi:hypothetical protein